MALTTCKNCGKKVSDTVEICVHCGKPINEPAAPDASDNAPSQQAAPFSLYSEDDRLELEREFLSGDGWAKKYRQTVEELPSFMRCGVYGLFLPILIISAFYKFNSSIPDFNSTLASISITCYIILAILSVGILLYAAITKIRLKSSMSKYIYMKKFQKWLKEEKGIEYTPHFIKNKEKEIFDRIDLDTFVS